MLRESNIEFIIYDKDGNRVFNGVTNNDGIIPQISQLNFLGKFLISISSVKTFQPTLSI